MARNMSTGSMKARPSSIQTKSFTRYEPSKTPSAISRSRANTVQPSLSSLSADPTTAYATSPDEINDTRAEDVFEKRIAEEEGEVIPSGLDRSLSRSQSLSERFDELPIELISLTDRFIESLTAKIYSEPPTVEMLSELFQDFYAKASSHISTHISTLYSRLNRTTPPNNSQAPSKSKSPSQKSSKDSADGSQNSAGGQQMLTASEVAEKRKARRRLEYKRVALEEAVERRACESVYEKIWRHKSTLDEVRDEKLRSKTASLSLVGIGLKDLGIEINGEGPAKEDLVRESLASARDHLAKMNDEKFPRGKLQHLTRAHKEIVDTLSTIHPSSSSADEILPTLIYTLITSPVEGINIISNLYFVQRFRARSKIDGEAAYCLTNLEAAISFLENVDLASLREDETPEGPMKPSSGLHTPMSEKEQFNFPPAMPSTTGQPTVATSSATASVSNLQVPRASTKSSMPSPLSSPPHQRRISNLLQPSTKMIGVANDVVRNTAEEGFKNISNTLDSSFKILFGRLKERSSDESSDEIVLPKTLDEARQLVSGPTLSEEDIMISETSSLAEKEGDSNAPASKQDEKLLGLIGGKKPTPLRERSADSSKSNGSGNGSGRRLAFTANSSSNLATAAAQNPLSTPANALESVLSLGNSLNPLSHIGSAFGGGFRGFGKAVSTPPAALSADKEKTISPPEPSPAVAAAATAPKPTGPDGFLTIDPPIQRFLDVTDPGDLKMKDVAELLHDYQRLARALKSLAEE